MDFTLKTYRKLLTSFSDAGYSFQTVENYMLCPGDKSIVLRHDVDRLPCNSLNTARIEHSLGIIGTYYFRTTPGSFDIAIIREIASMGHEIGYHYEDLSIIEKRKAYKKTGNGYGEKEIVSEAFESFLKNLRYFKTIVPVKTVCVHGSPLSKLDSRLIWKYFDYHDHGIICEPYFDLDFTKVLYLTDTGRRWNGGNTSVRDKWIIKNHNSDSDYYSDWKVYPPVGSAMNMTAESAVFQKRFSFTTSSDIIKALKEGKHSGSIMMTFHPQRWNDKSVLWISEYIGQNIRNVIKFFIVRKNSVT